MLEDYTVTTSVTKIDLLRINLTTVLAVVITTKAAVSDHRNGSFFIEFNCVFFLTVNHSSCNPGSNTTETHSGGSRSHTVLQIKTIL